jgi:hypothetical protein
MRSIILAAAFAMSMGSALACESLADQEEWLVRELGEEPIMTLVSHEGYTLALFANTENREWTILKMEEGPESACIVDYGRDLRLPEDRD